MKIKLAKTAGFCMGVKRAIEIALFQANKKDGKLFTYGPLIHNEQVLELLRSKGVHTIKDIADEQNGRVIIRAHGISPVERKGWRSQNFRLLMLHALAY